LPEALRGGVDWVQLRHKSAAAAALYAEAAALRAEVHAHGARLAINDRLDVALTVGADGVHLAGQSLPVAPAVELGGGRLLVGRSVHGLDEAVAAAQAGADYLTFGHVFPTTSHPGVPPRGLAELAAIVAAVDVPVLAIGGITVDNLPAVLATGCAGIAVISAILADPDPARAAERLRTTLERSPGTPRRPFPDTPPGSPPATHPTRPQGEMHAAHREPTTV
jgi:thiamine-phosphate pyrophosphorylase